MAQNSLFDKEFSNARSIVQETTFIETGNFAPDSIKLFVETIDMTLGFVLSNASCRESTLANNAISTLAFGNLWKKISIFRQKFDF